MGVDNKRKLTEDDLRGILSTYGMTKDGEIKRIDEMTEEENDTVPQGQQVMVPEEPQMPVRKTNFERKNEVLLDVKEDIPDRIAETGLHWVSISKHNQLMKLDKAGIAEAKISTIALYRFKSMDRKNRKLYTAADVRDIREFRTMLLSKSENGFERTLQSTEIVKTINEDANVPEKQGGGGLLGGFLDKLRGKK